MEENQINEMRAFNRFYTALIGVLNKRFLNSKYSIPELRVLQAIRFQEGITATEIIKNLNIRKSYLSRIILRLKKNKLISEESSPDDGRVVHLHVTSPGMKEYEAQDVVAHKQIKEILSQLSEKDCKNLIAAMLQIKEILSKPKL